MCLAARLLLSVLVATASIVSGGPIFPHLPTKGLETYLHGAEGAASPSAASSIREQAPPGEALGSFEKERRRLIHSYAVKAGWLSPIQRKVAVQRAGASPPTGSEEASTSSTEGSSRLPLKIHPALSHLYASNGRLMSQTEMAIKGGYDPSLLLSSPTERVRTFPGRQFVKDISELTNSARHKRLRREAEILAYERGVGSFPKSKEEGRLEVVQRRKEAKNWLTAHGIPHDASRDDFFPHPDSLIPGRSVSEQQQLEVHVRARRELGFVQHAHRAVAFDGFAAASARTKRRWREQMEAARDRQGAVGAQRTVSSPSNNAKEVETSKLAWLHHLERPRSSFSPPKTSPTSHEERPVSASAGPTEPAWTTHPKRPRTQMELIH